MAKTRKRRSDIWAISAERMQEALDQSDTFGKMLSFLGYDVVEGGRVRVLKQHMKELSIDYSKMPEGKSHNKDRRMKTDEEKVQSILPWLTEHDRQISRTNIRNRMIKSSLLENKCSECGIGPEWNGKPLQLQIDHINGKPYDYTRENLRLLCPNCHTQTETFAGRAVKRNKK